MLIGDGVLFINVPGTGGIRLTSYLLNNLKGPVALTVPEHAFAQVKSLVMFDDVHERLTLLLGPRHAGLSQAAAVLDRQGRRFEDVTVLAVVRNPYDLALSYFTQLQKQRSGQRHGPGAKSAKLAAVGDFERFAREALFNDVKQYYVMNGKIPDNLVPLRFEHLSDDVCRAVAAFSLNRLPLELPMPRPGRNGYRHWLTPIAEQAIFDKYQFLFGFYPRERHSCEHPVGDNGGHELSNVGAPNSLGAGSLSESDVYSLFVRNGTDKTIYAGLYQALFADRRHLVRRVLEIGIGTMIPGVHSSMVGYAADHYRPGGSLRAWATWFPNADIYAIDVQPDTQFVADRIRTYLCDSTDRQQISEFKRQCKVDEFDIIIDDGSHLLSDQIRTLQNFFPMLRAGGTYVLEDIADHSLRNKLDLFAAACGPSTLFLLSPDCNALVINKPA